jgi:hypothetical protein
MNISNIGKKIVLTPYVFAMMPNVAGAPIKVPYTAIDTKDIAVPLSIPFTFPG